MSRLRITARPTIAAAAAVLMLAAGPAAAWEQQGGAEQGGGLRALPSGGLMLKDVPSTDSTVESLPGVRLNPQARDGGGANCTQKRVSSLGYGASGDYGSGTLSECSFGNFTFSTMRPDPQPWVPGQPTPFGN